MKGTKIAVAVAGAALMLCVLAAAPVCAQILFELQGGAAFPTGDQNEYWGIGYTAGGTFLYELNPFVSLGVNLAYSKMGLDTEHFKSKFGLDDWELSGGDMTVFSACGELRAHAGGMDYATLFAGAGFGFFQLGITELERSFEGDTGSATFSSESQPGGYLHAGGAVSLAPMVKLGLKGQMTFYRYQMKNDTPETLELSDIRSFFSLMGVLSIGF